MNKNQYDRIKPWEGIWDLFKKDQHLRNLSYEEKKQLEAVYTELTDRVVNLTCGSCVAEMLTHLFMRFEKFEEKEIKEIKEDGKRRKRIKS